MEPHLTVEINSMEITNNKAMALKPVKWFSFLVNEL
jgi:hypothetical protein